MSSPPTRAEQRRREIEAAASELNGSAPARVAPLERPGARPSPKRRGWLVRRMLLLGDLLGLISAFALAQFTFGVAENASRGEEVGQFLLFLCSLPAWILCARLYGLYTRDEERPDHTTADDIVAIFHVATLGTWLSFAGAWILGAAEPDFGTVFVFWGLVIVFLIAFRALARGISRRRITYLQNTVIVGAGDVGQLVARKFLNHPEYGINLVGFVDHAPRDRAEDLDHVALLGPAERLSDVVSTFDIERVVIAFSSESEQQTLEVVRALKDFDIQIDIVPRLFEIVGPNVAVHTIEGLPLVGVPPLRLSRSSLALKRAMDVTLAALGLLVLSPLLAYVALRIRLDSPGPVLYRSDRIGRDGRRFKLVKFRTMRIEYCLGDSYGGGTAESEFARLLADPAMREEFDRTHKLAEDPRVTRFGDFLRRMSLDELPQLMNVLRGDISLVGPRPITVEEYSLLGLRIPDVAESDEESNIVNLRSALPGYWEIAHLRPGVTGYWQITGRSEISYEERLRLDMAYMNSWSLKLDLMIVAKTVRVLAAGQGAY